MVHDRMSNSEPTKNHYGGERVRILFDDETARQLQNLRAGARIVERFGESDLTVEFAEERGVSRLDAMDAKRRRNEFERLDIRRSAGVRRDADILDQCQRVEWRYEARKSRSARTGI